MNSIGYYGCNTHYGNSMNPSVLKEWGPKIAASVDAIVASGKYPILVYRGMSGVTAATIITNYMSSTLGDDYAMMYVRKKGEKSHGNKIERSRHDQCNREIVWVFCDDFISSGKTMLEVIQTLSRYYDMEIKLDSVRYALMLDINRWEEEASKVNDLTTALCNQYSEAASIAEKIQKKYEKFCVKENAARAARKTARDAVLNEIF